MQLGSFTSFYSPSQPLYQNMGLSVGAYCLLNKVWKTLNKFWLYRDAESVISNCMQVPRYSDAQRAALAANSSMRRLQTACSSTRR
jgi:hypothetical protein